MFSISMERCTQNKREWEYDSMSTNCCKCGKEAIVNANRECFDCANIGVKKYTTKKKTMKYATAGAIWIVTGVLDVMVTYSILQCTGINILASLFYAIVHLLLLGVMCIEKGYYGYATAPIIDLFIKVVLVVDVPYVIQNHEIQLGSILGDFVSNWLRTIELNPQVGNPMFFEGLYYFFIRPIIATIVLLMLFDLAMVIAARINRKSQDKAILEMNTLLDKEQRLQNFDNIKLYESNYTEARRRNVYVEDLMETDRFLDSSNASDEVKQKIYEMLRSWDDELMANNEVKLEYYDIVQQCMMGEIPQDTNGNWLDEIGADMRNMDLPVSLPESIALSKQEKYVTKSLFDLCARLESDVNIPWQKFVSRYNYLNPTGWMNAFMSDVKGIGAGETGENRVARELAMYDDQMMVLPNIRLEVEGESIESDFVVVSPWGVYILEVKNLGSGGAFDLLIEQDGRWSKVRGGYKEPMNSPVHQNERHIVYMEKMLNKKLGRGIDNRLMIHGMVVLANDRVTITNHSTNLIKRYDNIIGTIRSGERILKEEEMKQIAEILQNNNLPPKEYPTSNYFKLYFETKVLAEEYMHWRKCTQPLLSYAQTYYDTILEKYNGDARYEM